MDKHPIENIMRTTMENLRDMIDVNTVIGDPVQTGDGIMIIPISKVSFGFVAGGGEYEFACKAEKNPAFTEEEKPFAGGTGAGVTVNPLGFLVVTPDLVRMIPAQYNTPIDRIIEQVPQWIAEICKSSDKKDKETKTDRAEGFNNQRTSDSTGAEPDSFGQPTRIIPTEPLTPHTYAGTTYTNPNPYE